MIIDNYIVQKKKQIVEGRAIEKKDAEYRKKQEGVEFSAA